MYLPGHVSDVLTVGTNGAKNQPTILEESQPRWAGMAYWVRPNLWSSRVGTTTCRRDVLHRYRRRPAEFMRSAKTLYTTRIARSSRITPAALDLLVGPRPENFANYLVLTMWPSSVLLHFGTTMKVQIAKFTYSGLTSTFTFLAASCSTATE